MTEFQGCCVYPHRYCVTLGLIFASIGATVATLYAVISCRFVVVSFTSDKGNFENLFLVDPEGGSVPVQYQTAVGLFSWLKPKDPEGPWDDGSCLGYGERQRDQIADTIFEAVRILGIFATLLSITLLMWVFSLSCIAMGPRQVWLFSGFHLLMCIFVSLLFLITKSDLCQEVGQDTECALQDGGLVCIAAAILWFATFLVSVTFVKSPLSPSSDVMASTTRSREVEARRQEQRRRRKDVRERKLIASMESPGKVGIQSQAKSQTPETVVSFDSAMEDGAIEIGFKRGSRQH